MYNTIHIYNYKLFKILKSTKLSKVISKWFVIPNVQSIKLELKNLLLPQFKTNYNLNGLLHRHIFIFS